MYKLCAPRRADQASRWMRLKGLCILLVEDDDDNLELLSACLEEEGAITLSASSIAGALAVSIDRRVHAVVSDLELPDGDGCALLRQLAARTRQGLTPPAIAITGYSEKAWRDQAADCGFTHYAVKPFSMEQLIRWLVELSRASGESLATEDF